MDNKKKRCIAKRISLGSNIRLTSTFQERSSELLSARVTSHTDNCLLIEMTLVRNIRRRNRLLLAEKKACFISMTGKYDYVVRRNGAFEYF